jgi:hypothetical protein
MATQRSMKHDNYGTTVGTMAALFVMLLLTMAGKHAYGQAGSATVAGTVQDSSGAVIPGAKATLIEESTKVQRTAVSNKNGTILFVAIPPATYDVLVSAPGFRPARQNGIAVHIDDQLDLRNITLTVAGNDVSVTVTTETGQVTPTTSGEQSYTLSSEQIQNLNIESRSAIELLDLIPGSANTGNFTGSYNRQQAGFGQNGSTYTVNGNRFDQVQIVSDGASVTDLNTAGGAAVTPNIEMISEAKVETSAFSSVQPNGPIVFETQTKSGGSHYHGEAYLTARNHIFDATDAYTKELGLPKAQSSFYYPGFNIGGPVVFPHSNFNKNRDKLFFFAATEITQQHVDLGAQGAIVPTANMRQGIFSAAELNALSGGVYRNFYVTNQPCTGYAYSYTPYCSGVAYANGYNGVVNTAAIDKGGQELINALYPLPNTNPANNGEGYNLITDLVTSDPRNQENIKLDYAVNERTHLSGRFNHENENVPAPYGPYNTINYNTIPYPAAQEGRNASNSMNFNLTNTITQSLTNELAVAYTHFSLSITLGNQPAVSRTASAYPYPNVYPGSDILPNVSFSYNHASQQIPGGEVPPFATIQNTTTINDGITKQLGHHLLQFGFYDVFATYNNLTTGNDNGTIYSTIAGYGTYGAAGNPAAANPLNYAYQAIDNSTGNEFADLLVGDIAGYTQSSQNIMANMVNKRFDFYGEDTWKASSRLTLNYGARLDHIAWWYDKNGLIAVFNPAAYVASAPITAYSGMQTHATNAAIPISGAKPLSLQFAPSAGFAYNLDGRGNTILRGGAGTNYYVDPGINAYSAIGAPPNLDVFSYYTSSNAPLTLSTVSTINPATNPGVVYGSADPTDHGPAVTYSWNLALSHVFPAAVHVEASYVGDTSRHLNGYYETNVVPLGSETIASDGPYFGGNYYQQKYRPYPSFGDISFNEHNLGSNYHSLQVTASRAKGWFNSWLTYTFGKALGDTCEDAFIHQNCYGVVPFDRSQSINYSYYIILPNVSKNHLGDHKVVNGILDGWKISGIEQYGSGTPFTDIPQGGSNHNEYSGNQAIGIYGSIPTPPAIATSTGVTSVSISNDSVTGTPDETAVPFVSCDPRKGLKPHQYFNPSCFTSPGIGQNGTFRIPYIHGPSYFNDELGLFKDFKIRETGKLELRVQGFDFLNRSQDTYQQYDSSLYLGYANGINTAPTNTSTGGVTTTRTGHRSVQVAAKYSF